MNRQPEPLRAGALSVCAHGGRTLPAEWHAQLAVLLIWPHNREVWGKQWQALQQLYRRIALEIGRRQNVVICFKNKAQLFDINSVLQEESPQIHYCESVTNDIWVRDFGPLTLLTEGRPLLVDFCFTGWGNKYPSLLDDRFNQTLFEQELLSGYDKERCPLVWEGGNLDSNGAGTAIAGLHSAMTRVRPRGMVQADVTAQLQERLGLRQLIWIAAGQILGDDTDGHIDNLVRFAGENRLLYSCSSRADAEQHALLQPLEDELKNIRILPDQAPELVPLPIPRPIRRSKSAPRQDDRLPASYANFLLINGAVLMPVFDDPADETARQALAYCFPERDIIALPSRALIEQYGGIHCATMQIPSAGSTV